MSDITKNQKPHVFISYPRIEAELADKIVEALEKAGIRTWRDVNDIKPGDNWVASIEKAIRNAGAFVYLAGKGPGQSHWMTRELETLFRNQIDETVLIPVVYGSSGFNLLPDVAKQFQGVDISENLDEGLHKIVERLSAFAPKQHLGGTFAGDHSNSIPKKRIKGYAFISYATEDIDFLADLKEFLIESKYGFWDFHENKRNYELQFHLELEGVIRDSEAVLCVVSPDWKKSKWTPREFLFAEEIRKPIFLLRARNLEPTLLLAGSSYIDFVADKERGFHELRRELKAKGL